MPVFLDFEASSLGKHSYPVEIAWVFEDGRSRSFIIKPAPGWTDWSTEAETIHGISREQLDKDGVDVSVIAGEMVTTLADQDLYASAPSWDGKWLSALLRAAGHPRHALRLQKSDDAFLGAAKALLGSSMADKDIEAFVSDIIERTEPVNPPHRALPDARLERERWMLVRSEATARNPR